MRRIIWTVLATLLATWLLARALVRYAPPRTPDQTLLRQAEP